MTKVSSESKANLFELGQIHAAKVAAREACRKRFEVELVEVSRQYVYDASVLANVLRADGVSHSYIQEKIRLRNWGAYKAFMLIGEGVVR